MMPGARLARWVMIAVAVLVIVGLVFSSVQWGL
jgi:hypothetical protein